MLVEFVSPPESCEVIAQAEMDAVPRICEKVEINKKSYRVYSVEWVYLETNKCLPIINLIEDEVEEHAKKNG